MRKKGLIFSFVCAVMLYAGQFANAAVLYDNGPLVTHPAGGAGGADASALQTSLGLSTYGVGHQLVSGNRIADDFTVTGSNPWTINEIVFYAYQTGSTTATTITSVNYCIWDGVPGDPGSNVIFGDTITNKLTNSEWSGIYRVLDYELTTNTNRPIMKNTVSAGVKLQPGTYWLDWQTDGSLSSGPWSPLISILGQPTTGNGMQYLSDALNPSSLLSSTSLVDLSQDKAVDFKTDFGNGWNPYEDNGYLQGFPFILMGDAGPQKKLFSCDIDNNGIKEIVKIDENSNIYFFVGLKNWYQIPGTLSELHCGDINLDYETDFVGLTEDGSIYYSVDAGNAWGKISQAAKNGIVSVNLDGSLTWNQLAGNLEKMGLSDLNGNGTSEIYGLNSIGNIYAIYSLTTWQNIPGTLAEINAANFNLSRNGNEFVGLNTAGDVYYSSNLSSWAQVPGSLSMIATGDLNGDGKADIAGIGGNNVVYYTTDMINWQGIGGSLSFIATGDLNGDKKQDIIGFTASNDIYYTTDFFNWTKISGKAAALITGDLNGDGRDDVAIIGTDNKIYYSTNLTTWNMAD